MCCVAVKIAVNSFDSSSNSFSKAMRIIPASASISNQNPLSSASSTTSQFEPQTQLAIEHGKKPDSLLQPKSRTRKSCFPMTCASADRGSDR
jgi:hypothetical protein